MGHLKKAMRSYGVNWCYFEKVHENYPTIYDTTTLSYHTTNRKYDEFNDHLWSLTKQISSSLYMYFGI